MKKKTKRIVGTIFVALMSLAMVGWLILPALLTL